MLANIITTAYYLIFLAAASNFASRCVTLSLTLYSCYPLMLAKRVWAPTAQTIALPCPVIILESVSKNGSGLS